MLITYAPADLSNFRRPLGTVGHVSPEATPGQVDLSKLSPRARGWVEKGFTKDCGKRSRSELDAAVVVAMLDQDYTEEEITHVFQDAQHGIGAKYREECAKNNGDHYLSATLAAARAWVTTRTGKERREVRLRDNCLEVWRGDERGWQRLLDRPVRPVARFTGAKAGFYVEVPVLGVGEPERYFLRANAFDGIREFRAAIRKLDFATWNSNDPLELEAFVRYLRDTAPTTLATYNYLGWHGKTVIFRDQQLLPDGTLREDTGAQFINEDAISVELLPIDQAAWPAFARGTLELALSLHRRETVLPIVGWLMATFVAPQLFRLTKGFPPLVVFGVKGAGKSITCEALWRLTGGVDASDGPPADSTPWPLIKQIASSNTVPVFVDEHGGKNAERRIERRALYPIVRKAYNHKTESRGQPNLGVEYFPLLAPILIAGEAPLRDPALVDRAIHLRLEQFGKNEAALAAYNRLPLGQFTTGMYRRAMAADIPALYREVVALLPADLSQEKLWRQRTAYATAGLGLFLIRDLIADDVPAVVRGFGDIRAAAMEDVQDPEHSLIDTAVRVIAELVKAHKMQDGRDFAIKEGRLWIAHKIVLAAVEEYLNRNPTGITATSEVLQARLRDDAAKPDAVVVEYLGNFRISGRVVRGIAFDIARMEERCGVPGNLWSAEALAHA